MSSDWYEDLVEFHREFEHRIGTKPEIPDRFTQDLRMALIEEEWTETKLAIMKKDLAGIADGIADTIYVLLGTAVSYGIDLRPIWDEVQRSNMAKKGGEKREDGKTMKPPGWTPPNIIGLLMEQGMPVDEDQAKRVLDHSKEKDDPEDDDSEEPDTDESGEDHSDEKSGEAPALLGPRRVTSDQE